MFSLFLLQETVAASMTDMERNNLRRAMYSREAVRTEEDEEGERSWDTMSAVNCSQCFTDFRPIMTCTFVLAGNDIGGEWFPFLLCVFAEQ